MKVHLIALLCLAFSCGTVKSEHRDSGLQDTLDNLPTCGPGTNPGMVALKSSCTQKFCSYSCCNACSISAPSLLDLPDGALDCQVAEWIAILSENQIDVDAGCVVR